MAIQINRLRKWMLPMTSYHLLPLILMRSAICEAQLYVFLEAMLFMDSIISIFTSKGIPKFIRQIEMIMISHLVVKLII